MIAESFKGGCANRFFGVINGDSQLGHDDFTMHE
jgi:hypothetical protein